MQETAQVAIIGGGVVGCSLLYYLAEAGCADALLIESHELASGTTWGSSALVTHLTSSPFLTRLHGETLDLYRALEAETGESTGLHITGSLRLAASRERMTEYERYRARAEFEGHPLRIVTPEEIRALHPLIDTDGLLGAAHTPEDGYVEPASATRVLALAARKRGARILRGRPVRAIERSPGGDWVLATDDGPIRARAVVNAAGMWGGVVNRMVGADAPIVAMERQYFVTEPVAELAGQARELPVLRDPDGTFYMRQETDALLVGPYERRPIFWDVEGPPPPDGQQNLPAFLDEAAEPIADAMRRVPILERLGIQQTINVPTSRSPDGNPLVGPVAGLDGFYIAAGFFAGLSEASVCRRLAEWILEGEPGADIRPFDCRRYGDFATAEFVRARVAPRHIVGLTQAITYPQAEPAGGRPAGTSPLHAILEERGAVFGERFGMECPNWFAPDGTARVETLSFGRRNWFAAVGAECRAVRDCAGLLDLSASARFEIAGKGAAAFLDRVLASALPAEAGAGPALMLTPKGRIAGLGAVARLARDRFLLVFEPEARLDHREWLRRSLRADDRVEIGDVTERDGALLLAGPHARDILARATGADVGARALPPGAVRPITVANVETVAVRHSITGELAFEIHGAAGTLPAVYHALTAAGRDLGLVDFGYRALDSLRLEAGRRLWSREIGPGLTPDEAGLGDLVASGTGGFIGEDALAAARRSPAAKRLACLDMGSAHADCWGGEPVWHGDVPVALTITGGHGHRTEKSLALAVLPTALTEPGTTLAIEMQGERCAATVVREPLYEREDA